MIKNVYVLTEDGEKVKIGEVDIPSASTLTIDNPNSALVFTSLTGNLYTDQGLTTAVTTNTKYTQNTFYYNEGTVVSGEYLYSSGDSYGIAYYDSAEAIFEPGHSLYDYMNTSTSKDALNLLPSSDDYVSYYNSGVLSQFPEAISYSNDKVWTGTYSNS